MKKVIAMIAISALMALCLAGCGSSEGSSSSSSSSAEDVAVEAAETPIGNSGAFVTSDAAADGNSYEGFLEEYIYRMELETPVLIDEYNSQSEPLGNDTRAKEELRDEKIAALESICTEGVDKMAELRVKTHGDYSEYEEYANRLQDAYQAQAEAIRNA